MNKHTSAHQYAILFNNGDLKTVYAHYYSYLAGMFEFWIIGYYQDKEIRALVCSHHISTVEHVVRQNEYTPEQIEADLKGDSNG